MAIYLTVDGGTTNTRIYLVCDRQVKDTCKLSVGARNGTEALKVALREGISRLLERNGIGQTNVARIIASGMITSEYGLCELPHLTLPAGASELYGALYERCFPDISDIPWSFVRGVKSVGECLETSDVMRGEETELMGLMESTQEGRLYVLPGSHSKHISVDREGRIVAFQTMMTGELFAAVMQNTILKDAADFEHNDLDEVELLHGYSYAVKHGINEALFKTRILKNLFGATREQCYSFLLGCVLCDEVRSILRAEEQTVVLGGQKQFRMALAFLLKQTCQKRIVMLSDAQVEQSTAMGAVRIFEFD